MHTHPPACGIRGRTSQRIRSSVMALIALALVSAPAEERQPERRELWVPTKDLHEVLKEHPNAVMLDRAQYEALIRDAGKVKPNEKDKPPGGIAIESIKVSATVIDGAPSTQLTIEVAYTSFVDRWTAVNLGASWFVLSNAVLDSESLVAWTLADGKTTDKPVTNTDERELLIMTKKAGHHVARLSVESPLLWSAQEGEMKLPTYGWRRDLMAEIELPDLATMLMPSRAVRMSPKKFRFLAPSQLGSVRWNRKGNIATTADWALRQAVVRCEATDEGVSSRVHLGFASERESLPPQFVLVMPADGMNIVSVNGLAVGRWHQEGRRVVVDLDRSWSWHFGLDLVVEQSWVDTASGSALALPVPLVEGSQARPATRVLVHQKGGHRLVDLSGQGMTPLSAEDWAADYTLGKLQWRPSKQEFPELAGDLAMVRGAGFAALPSDARMVFRRVGDQFSADVDNRVVITAHEMMLDRAVAIHGEEGSVNRVTLTLPANEQFLSLGVVNGEPLDWKQVQGEKGATKLELAWPKTLRKGQTTTLALRTRQDIATTEGATQKLTIENVSVKDATRVAGYMALDFDESWKVATPSSTGLESRDARVTPVQGRMAWFNLRDYKLDLEISRNEPVLDASVLAYALPRAKQVEIEGQVALAVSRAPLRKFDVKLPVATAKLLRVESPLIGQQQLDEASGVWHLTLRRELLGPASIRFHLSLPAAVEPGGEAKLSATLPRFEVPSARRFTGQWVIEANTDTELSYETKGVQPLDTQLAGRVGGYAPRHRVLAAYDYGASDHSVKITATRHEAGALVSAVVESMELSSVLGRDGINRHTAKLKVRHNGQQFMALKLPAAARLLSAKVDSETVKPVQAGESEVRVPLSANAPSAAVELIYELKGVPWSGSGQQHLEPPSVGESVPVLSSSWWVYAPDGMEVSSADPNLKLRNVRPTPALIDGAWTMCGSILGRLQILGRMQYASAKRKGGVTNADIAQLATPSVQGLITAGAAPAPAPMPAAAVPAPDPFAAGPSGSRYYEEKMQRVMLPSVNFQGATVEEAIEFLRMKSKDLDSVERDPSRKGVNMIVKSGTAPSTAHITLDLKDVPLIEALRYVTELAGMKYKIEPYAVVIQPITEAATELYTRVIKVPPDFLSRATASPPDPNAPQPNGAGLRAKASAVGILNTSGGALPEGASAIFNPATSELTLTNTQANLNAWTAEITKISRGITDLTASGGIEASADPSAGGPGLLPPDPFGDDDRRLATKSGLISLDLTVPSVGRLLAINGHQKPEALVLVYRSWERQMMWTVLQLVAGVLLFALLGRRRPWLRTALAVLLLTCLPLWLAPTWVAAANALLLGWLAGFAFHLCCGLARWMESKLDLHLDAKGEAV